MRDLASDYEFLVGCRRSPKAFRGLFLGGLQGLEMVGPMVGFKLAGLTNVAAASQDMIETVDEMALIHEQSLYVDPVARLALSVVQLAVAVDAHNRGDRSCRSIGQATTSSRQLRGTEASAEPTPR